MVFTQTHSSALLTRTAVSAVLHFLVAKESCEVGHNRPELKLPAFRTASV